MPVNGVCIGIPVGYVLGAIGTCRTGYYSSNGSCFRNENDLRLYSSMRSIDPIINRIPTSSIDFYTLTTGNNTLVIFSILVSVSSTTSISQNSSFILYYRNKANNPLICWNSCIPTLVDNANFIRNLVHPIIAT